MKKKTLKQEIELLINVGILAPTEFNQDEWVEYDAYRLFFNDGIVAEESGGLNDFLTLAVRYFDAIVTKTWFDNNIASFSIDCKWEG